ncbi:MAG: Asp-tRNA(Asn)/Glu-tRNA(Gln) amidotransferase subunit GatA, partial [Deltaproteobacteria bacterium]|nr:Asp-tRNA(Asn)/Glu-tRNA(Gln) amidotransferase subunit GatA [Deltaproteobacteria bacterium]
MQLHELTIQEAHAKLISGDISSLDLTRAALERIQAVESKVDAFITLDEASALQQAAACDSRIATGDTTPLTGIPLAIKDLMC